MLPPTISEISLATCLHFEISVSDLRGPSRERRFSRPRQIAMYLCYMLEAGKMAQIGRYIGYRDHTTVLHAIRTINQMLSYDRVVIEAIADIHILAARMVRTRQPDDLLDAVA